MRDKIEVIIQNLSKRNINGHYFETSADAKDAILSWIPKEATIGIGNSRTVKDMDLSATLSDKGHIVYDKTTVQSDLGKKLLKKKALTTDWYITGTNALAKSGHLVNIDHSGSRVAAMLYGPDNVIIVVGVNKIEDSLENALDRARNEAAPRNAVRAGSGSPCIEAGKCVECEGDVRICNAFVTVSGQSDADRMRVVIINEELGF